MISFYKSSEELSVSININLPHNPELKRKKKFFYVSKKV